MKSDREVSLSLLTYLNTAELMQTRTQVECQNTKEKIGGYYAMSIEFQS